MKLPIVRGLNLSSFLIKPVQRICKYPLIIREVLKYTEESNPDFDYLKRAMEKLEGVLSVVNEGARKADGGRKMLEIQGSFMEVSC